MKCNYTATFEFVDGDVDTLDRVYTLDLLKEIGLPFNDVAGIQAKLDEFKADIEGGGWTVTEITYTVQGNTMTMVFVYSSAQAYGFDWTTNGTPDGGGSFTSSLCQTCNLEAAFDNSENSILFSLNLGQSGIVINLPFTDVAGIQAALESFYSQATGEVSYTWDGTNGLIKVYGWTGIPAPSFITINDGPETPSPVINFTDASCVDAVAPTNLCDEISCDEKDISVEEMIRMALTPNEDCDEQRYLLNVTEAASDAPAVTCDENLDLLTIIRKLFVTGDCKRFRIERNATFDPQPYYTCDNAEEPAEVPFRKAVYKTADGCYVLRTGDVAVSDPCASVTCDSLDDAETLLRKLFIVDGDDVLVAVNAITGLECSPIGCDEKEISLAEILAMTVASSDIAGVFALMLNTDSEPAQGLTGFRVNGGVDMNGFGASSRYMNILEPNILDGYYDNEGHIVRSDEVVSAPDPPTSYLDIPTARTYNHHWHIQVRVTVWIPGLSTLQVRLNSGEVLYTHTDDDVGEGAGVYVADFTVDREIAYGAGSKEFLIVDLDGLVNGQAQYIEWIGE